MAKTMSAGCFSSGTRAQQVARLAGRQLRSMSLTIPQLHQDDQLETNKISGGARKPSIADITNPDRRFRDQFALRVGRGRIHADVRRIRRAQPIPWRHHAGRRRGRLAGGRINSAPMAARPGRAGWPGWPPPFATYFLVVRPIQRSRAIPQLGDRDLRPDGHPTLRHHAAGSGGLFHHHQPAYRPPADRRRGQHRRRAYPRQRDPDRNHLLGRDRLVSGC